MNSFIYVIRPIDLTISERIELITNQILPNSINRKPWINLLFSDVINVVREHLNTATLLPNTPVIDFHGFDYSHLTYLVDVLRCNQDTNNSVDAERLIYSYIESIEYIVNSCWLDLQHLLHSFPSCDIQNVKFRDSTIVLWCY